MNVVKCQKGHFFDADSYAQCPHCGAPVAADAPAPAPNTASAQKHSFWGGFGRNKSKEKYAAADAKPFEPVQPPVQDYGSGLQEGNSITDVMDPLPAPAPAPQPYSGGKTMDIWKSTEEAASGDSFVAPAPRENVIAEPPAPAPAPQPVPVPAPQPAPEVSTLKAAVQQASASSEGKTMSYFSAATAPQSAISAAAGQSTRAVEPVVGWLIGIGGKHLGDSFIIHAGKNSIGRGSDNDIIIDLDQTISRVKHALIVYEPKKRNFFLQPGDSSGLTYLNEEYITDSRKLTARDVIELGDSKLMFIPLCGPDFSWEDYMGKENN